MKGCFQPPTANRFGLLTVLRDVVTVAGLMYGQTGYELDAQAVALLRGLLNGPALSRELAGTESSRHAVARRLAVLKRRGLVCSSPFGLPGSPPAVGRGSFLWDITAEGHALLSLRIANDCAANRAIIPRRAIE
jgi:hypothetical protein